MTELTLFNGEPIVFKNAVARKFRGNRLPGAELRQATVPGLSISLHEYSQKLFGFSLRNIVVEKSNSVTLKESSNYLRFEAVIAGIFNLKEENGSEMKMAPGHYRMTSAKKYLANFDTNVDCDYFVAYISPELLLQTPLSETIVPTNVQMMSGPMREVIYRILENPFEEKFRDAFYDYSIRELLFYHISAPQFTPPGELSQAELAAIYEADRIISSNLSVHYSINELARMTHTNVHVLKTGFARLFGMGTFERLLQRKMERAKYLLETTDRQVQDISELSGYETVTGFINAFRKQFKMTPKDWRKKQRGLL